MPQRRFEPPTRAVLSLCALAAAALAACNDPPLQPSTVDLVVVPLTLDFGTQAAGSTTKKTLTIANRGRGSATLTAATITGDARQAFTAGILPPTLASGASATIEVTYLAPVQPGTDAASITIAPGGTAIALTIPVTARSGDATCADTIQNGAETSVDCGGAQCPGCLAGATCRGATDCDAGLGCTSGTCGKCSESASCRTGQICVAGLCQGCAKDAECAAGSTCVNGACSACPGATTAIDTATDPLNCGQCGHACPAPLHAAPMCFAGHCGRGPCAKGFFDLGGTFGCETTCADHVCTDDQGSTTTVTNDPLPEQGNVFRSLSSGSSYAGHVQTGSTYTNMATLGEALPPASGGAVRQTSDHWQNTPGIKSAVPKE